MKNQTDLKIFIVEDDPFSRHLYKQHLLNLGCQDVTTFSSGMACLDAIDRQPSIVFLDYRMEELNGLEVLEKIKNFNHNIYVVFISGQEDPSIAWHSLKSGAFDFIVKGHNDFKRIENVLARIMEVKQVLLRTNNNFFKKILAAI